MPTGPPACRHTFVADAAVWAGFHMMFIVCSFLFPLGLQVPCTTTPYAPQHSTAHLVHHNTLQRTLCTTTLYSAPVAAHPLSSTPVAAHPLSSTPPRRTPHHTARRTPHRSPYRSAHCSPLAVHHSAPLHTTLFAVHHIVPCKPHCSLFIAPQPHSRYAGHVFPRLLKRRSCGHIRKPLRTSPQAHLTRPQSRPRPSIQRTLIPRDQTLTTNSSAFPTLAASHAARNRSLRSRLCSCCQM